MVMRKGFSAAFLLLVLLVVLGGCGGNTAAEDGKWGRADAKEIDVSSKIPGRVVELLVKEGDRVEAGQVIARIDKRDLIAQKEQMVANIEAIRAQQGQAAISTVFQQGSTSAGTSSASAALERAGADLEMARADYERYAALVESGAVSRQAFEKYRTQYQVAQAAYSQAQAAAAQAAAATLQTDVSRANEAVTASKLAQAEAALKQLLVSLDETEIRAPFAGVITAKYVEEGSMISTGTPLVAVQDPDDNWVDVKVPETELGNFALHQEVRLQARDGKTEVTGTIVDISRKSEFATQRATSERGDATDIISFNVKIQVNDSALRPGMRFKLLGGSL
ncbi:HlyD family secretion protein [Anaerovibrio sp.]|uniref:HlyD family secretion protein n=1 Tax=Anaerovibrio sp. TaxID=1872532 RepID=UPI003F174D5F